MSAKSSSQVCTEILRVVRVQTHPLSSTPPYSVIWRMPTTILCLSSYVFFSYTSFLEQFQVPSKSEQKVPRVPICPLPLHIHSPPPVNILHHSGTLAPLEEPALTDHCHPEFIAYTEVHSWCCASYVFGQVHNHRYPPL